MSDIMKETMVKQETRVGVRCDICKKQELDFVAYDHWFNGNYHHADWGNDSHESFVYIDACSANCMIKALKRAVKELSCNKRSAEIFGMPWAIADDFCKLIKDLIKKEKNEAPV